MDLLNLSFLLPALCYIQPQHPYRLKSASAFLTNLLLSFFLNPLIFLLILALAAFAAAWYYTGGDLTALPQRLQSLGADSLPHAGAKLI